MTYPLPLGFQHAQYCSLVFFGYGRGISLGCCAFFMLEFQEHALLNVKFPITVIENRSWLNLLENRNKQRNNPYLS
jgi:hypothetical protein